MRTIATILTAAGLAISANCQETVNTIKTAPTDTQEEIVAKAVRVVPTAQQLSALENEFIAFIHFGPNTFTRREWGTGKEDPQVFDLKSLDTDQWVKAMKDAGMKMVIFTAKHHDGFVLWQSRYTKHGIMSSPFLDGKGDILKDLSESCRKYGMKLGVYLSPADLYQIENPEGLYGNLSEKTLRTIPRETGRPFENQTKFEFVVDDYNEYFLNQLFELLTEYGPIDEVWFDGAHPKRKGGQTYNYPAWRELIRTLAPGAVIFGREDVRWCGNEAGGTRATERNVVGYDGDPDTMTVFKDMTDYDLGSREKLAESPYIHYQQAETNTSIREGWFYRDDDRQTVRSADDVFDIYERSVGGNSTFLLNIPPNREGRFSERDVKVLEEVGRRIEATYGEGTDLLAGSDAVGELTDNDIHTYTEVTEPLVINLPEKRRINRLVIQEPIAEGSERIEAIAIDAATNGEWKEIGKAESVGYKKIFRFPEVTTDKLRIRIEASRATPLLSKVSAHHYAAHAPQLEISQGADGTVAIGAKNAGFGWKSHGENPAENLNGGYVVYYTTDGSDPTTASKVYSEPFYQEPGMVKAVAILEGETGPVASMQTAYKKVDWAVNDVSGSMIGNDAPKAFDGDRNTYWYSGEMKEPFIVIDAGRDLTINGLAYTPPTTTDKGMLAKGELLTSKDGKKWKSVEVFEFGNLINDPTTRYHYLKKAVKGRYFKIIGKEATGGNHGCAIAEIDLF